MKLNTLRTLGLAALTGGMLLFSGCSKDLIAPESTLSAEDQGNAEDEAANVSDFVEAAAPADVTQSNSAVLAPDDFEKVGSRCATRTYDAGTHTLTLDFGTTNCIGADGRARRGKIVAVFSGAPRQAGSIKTVSLVNYFVNDNQHTGTRILTSLGNGSYSLDVQNASVITPTGTHSWTAQRTYTRTAGAATPSILDDKYSVTGSATGTNRKGVSYTATIQQPLVKVFTPGCARHFVAGTVAITNSKEKSLLLNYDPTGTEACDNIASITINGKTRTIRLR